MLLFFQVLFTIFIAEMGDKTQLLMIAMTSRYKLRDILIGAFASILALNAIAVAFGAIISALIPTWLIKLAAGLAFFYFAWSTLHDEEEDEEDASKVGKHPILTVFGTFFIAEFGDKTQLSAIAFAASGGLSYALIIWAACSIGLFAADVIGMAIGYLIKEKMPDGFLDKLAFVIFAVFGFTTLAEGTNYLMNGSILHWIPPVAFAILFAVFCHTTLNNNKTNQDSSI